MTDFFTVFLDWYNELNSDAKFLNKKIWMGENLKFKKRLHELPTRWLLLPYLL